MSEIERKTRGRQKVPLIRMEKESNRLVTFSKRRSGLFKKVSELCTLCGADAAIVVFSPGKKAYSFGHPSVDVNVNRFLFAETFFNPNMIHDQTSEPHKNESILIFNVELTLTHEHIEWEKKTSENHLFDRKIRKEEFEWLIYSEEVVGEILEKIQGLIKPLMNRVSQLYQKLDLEFKNTNSSLLTGPNASEPSYQFPQGIIGGKTPMSILCSGQPHPMATVIPTGLVGGSINYGQSQMMMMFLLNQPPIGGGFGDSSLTGMGTGFGDPSLTGMGRGFGDPSSPRGSGDIAIDHLLNANASASASATATLNVNPISSQPNPMGFGFPNPNLLPSFQQENNPMGGQLDGLPPLPPMNIGINPMPPMNMGFNPMPPMNMGLNPMPPMNMGLNPTPPMNMGMNPMPPMNMGMNPPPPMNMGMNPPPPMNMGMNPTPPMNMGMNPMPPMNMGMNPPPPMNMGMNPPPPMNMGMNPPPPMNMGMNPMPPMNMGMDPMQVDFQNFASSSSQAGMNSMDTPTGPYNHQNGYGFGNGLY